LTELNYFSVIGEEKNAENGSGRTDLVRKCPGNGAHYKRLSVTERSTFLVVELHCRSGPFTDFAGSVKGRDKELLVIPRSVTPPALPQEINMKPQRSTLRLNLYEKNWSGRADLNGRPPAPKAGALTRLRYAPTSIICKEKLTHYEGQNNSRKTAANRETIE
jgi:hypothetical protein